MTLTVVLQRDDVANGDDNRPWPMEFPDDARVGHVVLAYVRERYLPAMPGSAWLVRRVQGDRSDPVALLVTLDHPHEPLVLTIDRGSGGGRRAVDAPSWRAPDGSFAFHAAYCPGSGPLSFAAYAEWTEG